jgi:hypothetical protein
MDQEKIRTDYEPIRQMGSRVGFEKGRVGRVKVSPAELASFNLYKVLEKYSEYFTKEARSQIQEEYRNFENLETINLEVFASVLAFLKNHPNPTPDDFKDEVILEYFTRLLPTSSIDRERIILRLKAEFLKYYTAILAFKYKEQEKFEEYEGDEEQDQYEDEDYDESE